MFVMFSYDPDNLAEPLNHLRFLIQDTTADGHFFENAEIDFIAGEETNIYRAAARLCRTCALKVLKRSGLEEKEGLQYDPEEKSKEYRAMAKNFEEKADDLDNPPVTPSTAESGMRMPRLRQQCSSPAFTRKMHISD